MWASRASVDMISLFTTGAGGNPESEATHVDGDRETDAPTAAAAAPEGGNENEPVPGTRDPPANPPAAPTPQDSR